MFYNKCFKTVFMNCLFHAFYYKYFISFVQGLGFGLLNFTLSSHYSNSFIENIYEETTVIPQGFLIVTERTLY